MRNIGEVGPITPPGINYSQSGSNRITWEHKAKTTEEHDATVENATWSRKLCKNLIN